MPGNQAVTRWLTLGALLAAGCGGGGGGGSGTTGSTGNGGGDQQQRLDFRRVCRGLRLRGALRDTAPRHRSREQRSLARQTGHAHRREPLAPRLEPRPLSLVRGPPGPQSRELHDGELLRPAQELGHDAGRPSEGPLPLRDPDQRLARARWRRGRGRLWRAVDGPRQLATAAARRRLRRAGLGRGVAARRARTRRRSAGGRRRRPRQRQRRGVRGPLNAGLSPAVSGEMHTFTIVEPGVAGQRTITLQAARIATAPVPVVGTPWRPQPDRWATCSSTITTRPRRAASSMP